MNESSPSFDQTAPSLPVPSSVHSPYESPPNCTFQSQPQSLNQVPGIPPAFSCAPANKHHIDSRQYQWPLCASSTSGPKIAGEFHGGGWQGLNHSYPPSPAGPSMEWTPHGDSTPSSQSSVQSTPYFKNEAPSPHIVPARAPLQVPPPPRQSIPPPPDSSHASPHYPTPLHSLSHQPQNHLRPHTYMLSGSQNSFNVVPPHPKQRPFQPPVCPRPTRSGLPFPSTPIVPAAGPAQVQPASVAAQGSAGPYFVTVPPGSVAQPILPRNEYTMQHLRGPVTKEEEDTSSQQAQQDEVMTEERKKRMRNEREQRRAHLITDQIETLKHVLENGHCPFRSPSKYDVLAGCDEYIQILKQRRDYLSAEKRDQEAAEKSSALKVDNQMAPNSSDQKAIVLNFCEVFQTSHVPMAVVSMDGRILRCSDEFSRVTGYTNDRLADVTLFSLAAPEGLEDLFKSTAQLLSTAGLEERNPAYFATAAAKATHLPAMGYEASYLLLSLIRDRKGQAKAFNCCIVPRQPQTAVAQSSVEGSSRQQL